MSRKIVLLNLALVALAGVLIWQIRVHWRGATGHERAVLTQKPHTPPVTPPPPLTPVKPAAPADYIDVAQRTLFSRDRNPNVEIVVPAPPPPPPQKPMPELPFYHGQMSLGEPVVLLSIKGTDQKSYHAGDDVGAFKVVAFDHESITLEWDGKTVERKFAEMKPKEPPPQAAQSPAVPSAANPAAAPGGPSIRTLGGATVPGNANSNNAPKRGNDMGGGFFGCAAGDDSPAGTVADGYKKVIARTAIASSCHWEQVK